VYETPSDDRRPDNESDSESTSAEVVLLNGNSLRFLSTEEHIPAFDGRLDLTAAAFRVRLIEVRDAWLSRSPSEKTRENYDRDLRQFLLFVGASSDQLDALTTIRPAHVAEWRDSLRAAGLCNASILRKMTVLRSLFSYLQTYGYTGANPAHSHFVQAPAVPRDGKTVGLTPTDCRRLLDAPDPLTPAGIRDRAILAILSYSACRVGELARLRVRNYRDSSGHKVEVVPAVVEKLAAG
jgi:integrase/recombinase XerD